MGIKTINDNSNMSYKHYMDQPRSMCGRKTNMIIAKNPQLLSSLDRNRKHPLKRKYSHIPHNINNYLQRHK